MGLALEKAKVAFSNGEFPVGCVVVKNKLVIADSSRHGTSG
ncbi:MAG: nucleoside deaminase, partial [Desulfobacteraceae bacterium]|nr:nucleoside deaminase [Desulfobacteraceae bacterium]